MKVNVWACFCGRGLGYMHIFNGKLNAKLLRSILINNLLPSAKLHFSFDPPEQWYFQHDNDRKFTGNLVQTWLHNNGIPLLDFPAYSPDLNPIENLWNDMARRVEQRPAPTMEILQDIVAEEWKATSIEFIQKLVASMPARCRAVIAANGGYTHY